MLHALIAVIFQAAVGLTRGAWGAGALAASTFFVARELTQAEYRWIEQLGDGTRASMPWWGAVDPAVWNLKSLADAGLPILATCLVLLMVRNAAR